MPCRYIATTIFRMHMLCIHDRVAPRFQTKADGQTERVCTSELQQASHLNLSCLTRGYDSPGRPVTDCPPFHPFWTWPIIRRKTGSLIPRQGDINDTGNSRATTLRFLGSPSSAMNRRTYTWPPPKTRTAGNRSGVPSPSQCAIRNSFKRVAMVINSACLVVCMLSHLKSRRGHLCCFPWRIYNTRDPLGRTNTVRNPVLSLRRRTEPVRRRNIIRQIGGFVLDKSTNLPIIVHLSQR